MGSFMITSLKAVQTRTSPDLQVNFSSPFKRSSVKDFGAKLEYSIHYMSLSLLLYNRLKIRTVIVLLPWNQHLISRDWAGPLPMDASWELDITLEARAPSLWKVTQWHMKPEKFTFLVLTWFGHCLKLAAKPSILGLCGVGLFHRLYHLSLPCYCSRCREGWDEGCSVGCSLQLHTDRCH